MCTSIIYT